MPFRFQFPKRGDIMTSPTTSRKSSAQLTGNLTDTNTSGGIGTNKLMGIKNESVFRETVSSLHKASTNSDGTVRESAITSLEVVAVQMPLMVKIPLLYHSRLYRHDNVVFQALQTWLDQFARTNGGSSAAEYAAKDRIFMLQALERIASKMISEESNLDELNVANRACVGRIIAMATEEMTRHPEVIPDVQKPCSSILVKLGEKFLDRVNGFTPAKISTRNSTTLLRGVHPGQSRYEMRHERCQLS